MNDLRRISLLRDMVKHLKDAPLSKCLEYVDMIVRAEREAYDMKSALSMLTLPLGFDENGGAPKALVLRYKDDRAVLSALHSVQYCHGWTVCGPVSDGFGLLKKEMEKRVLSKSFFDEILKSEDDTC